MSEEHIKQTLVWDVTPEKFKIEVFNIVVQAMYNALVVLSDLSKEVEFENADAIRTLHDLRNVNRMLYSAGIRPTYPRKTLEDGTVLLKHIDKCIIESVIDEFNAEISANKLKWHEQQYDKFSEMKKTIEDLKFRLHMYKKYCHDKIEKENDNECKI